MTIKLLQVHFDGFLTLTTQFDSETTRFRAFVMSMDHGSSDFTLFDCLVLEMVLFRLSPVATSS